MNLKRQNFNFKRMGLHNPPRYNKMTFMKFFDKFLENENNPNTANVKKMKRTRKPLTFGDFSIDVQSKNLMVDTDSNSIAANGFEFFCDNSIRVTETLSS